MLAAPVTVVTDTPWLPSFCHRLWTFAESAVCSSLDGAAELLGHSVIDSRSAYPVFACEGKICGATCAF